MNSKFLHREDAPFGSDVWQKIDDTVVQAAKGEMSARRLLHTDGPFGLGLRVLPGPDREVPEAETVSERVTVSTSGSLPVVSISSRFSLSARDIAALEDRGEPMDLGHVAAAAIECARQEDSLVFNGSEALGAPGLLTADGVHRRDLDDWNDIGSAAGDVIAAVTELDGAGFHGPFALALSPGRYNLLFRLYERGDVTEMAHLGQIAADGIVKAPALRSGGVLMASGRQFATIVLGQDLAAGLIGPVSGGYEFTLAESMALRLMEPRAVCVLR